MKPTLSPAADRVIRQALLGVRCLDAVDGRLLQEGLQVELIDGWRPGAGQRSASTTRLSAGPGGVFVLHDLRGGTTPTESPATQDRFEIRVHDAAQRYVDTAVHVGLPGDGIVEVPMYSAATRTPPPALACLRAELRRASRPDEAARWAWLQLRLGAQVLAEGPSDASGRALLVFPLPRPREGVLHGSPATAESLLDWSVSLHARWEPARQAENLPDLHTLRSQAEVPLLQQRAPAVPLTPLSLQAGQPLLAHRPPSSFLFVAD
jgi:hypothetical protein